MKKNALKHSSFILLGLILSAGFFLRLYRVDQNFMTCETHNLLWGIRLHGLPWFNLKAIMLDNFFKSFIGAIGGLRFVFSSYVASTIYSLLGIPLSEFWMFLFHVVLGTLVIVYTFFLGRVWHSPRVGVLAAAYVAANPELIVSSRWDNGEPLVTLSVLFATWYTFTVSSKRKGFSELFLGCLYAVILSMESLMALPLLGFYLFSVDSSSKESFKVRLINFLKRVTRLPGLFLILVPAFALLAHTLTYFWVGRVSNLGMFGYISMRYSEHSALWESLLRVPLVFQKLAEYYHPVFFYGSLILFVVLVITQQKRFRFEKLGWSALAFAYFLAVFLRIPASTNAHPHFYICAPFFLIFFASVWVEGWEECRVLFTWQKPLFFIFRTLVGGVPLVVLSIVFLQDFYAALNKRPLLVHPMKAIGYYVREQGHKFATVMDLWNCSNACPLMFGEYYYGKQLINVDSKETPRTIFCLGSSSVSDILKHYDLQDFDFYVKYKKYYFLFPDGKRDERLVSDAKADLVIQTLKKTGLRKVSDITDGTEILAEIYSRHDYPFKVLSIQDIGPQWDHKFANLQNLFESKLVGICATWGMHWDVGRGY